MMEQGIQMLAGPVGSGKGLSLVRAICAALSAGRTVVTNVDLHWDPVVDYCGFEWGVVPDRAQYIYVTRDQLGELVRSDGTPGLLPQGTRDCFVLLALDEASLFAPQQGVGKQDAARAERLRSYHTLVEWLYCSRHWHVDVLLAAQHEANTSADIKRNVEYVWWHQDMRKHPVFGPFCRLFRVHRVRMCCQKVGQKGDPIHTEFFTASKRLYACYDTDAVMDSRFSMIAVPRRKVQRVGWENAGVRAAGWRMAGLAAGFILCLGCLGCMRAEKKRVRSLLAEAEEARRAWVRPVVLTQVVERVATGGISAGVFPGRQSSVDRKTAGVPVLWVNGRTQEGVVIGSEEFRPGDWLPDGRHLDAYRGRIALIDGAWHSVLLFEAKAEAAGK